MEGIAADNEKVVTEPAPRIRIRGFGDNSINLELLCWIRKPADRGIVVHDLNYQLIKRFRAEHIEIPFPQRDVHVRDLPSEPKPPEPD
jgi:MscS family membrane protein